MDFLVKSHIHSRYPPSSVKSDYVIKKMPVWISKSTYKYNKKVRIVMFGVLLLGMETMHVIYGFIALRFKIHDNYLFPMVCVRTACGSQMIGFHM